MLVIGLTGGIGSGKSTVAELFSGLGVPIIDADIIARDIVKPGKPALKEIINHFGNQILAADETLDRAKLRQRIFNHSTERLWLEELLHPLIREEMQKQISAIKSPYCIAVIPLLVEVKFYSFINRVLVIDAGEESQIERVMKRDQVDRSHIEAILKTQTKRHDRLRCAHDIIINDGILADLIPQVEKLHKIYLDLSKN